MWKSAALACSCSVTLASCAVLVLGPDREVAEDAGPSGASTAASSGGGAAGGMGGAGGAGSGGSATMCSGGRVLWVRRFGDAAEQEAYAAEADLEGGVYVAGQFDGELALEDDVYTGNGDYDMFLARFDRDGNKLWSKAFGDSGQQAGQTRLTRTPDGGVLFSGNFQGTVDFGGGPRKAKGGEGFIASYDASGSYRWDWTSTGSGNEAVRRVAIDDAGGLVVAGSFNGQGSFGGLPVNSVGADDVFLARLGSGGQHAWSKGFGSIGHDAAEWVAIDPEQRIVLAGSAGGEIDLGDGPLDHTGSADVFAAVYDGDGEAVWTKLWGAVGDQGALRIAIHPTNGAILLGGLMNGTLEFGEKFISSYGAFLVWLTPMGDHLQSKAFNDVYPRFGLAVDATGAAVIAGSHEEVLDLGGTPKRSAGGLDGFIAKLDPEFGHVWTVAFGSAEEDKAISVALDADSNVFAVGHFQQTITLEGCPPLVSAGTRDVLLMKLVP